MKPAAANISLGAKGRLRVRVMQGEKTVLEGPWKRNLILDRGLDLWATKLIPEMFEVCGKGTGTEATKEVVDTANNFTQSSLTVTRVAGTYDFTAGADKEGALIKFLTTPAKYAKIESVIDADEVTVDRVNTGVSAVDIELYYVEHDWEIAEEAFATISGAAITGTKPLGDATFTASGAIFTADDVGRVIYVNGTKQAFEIVSFTSTTEVEVDNTDDVDISAETFAVYTPREGSTLPVSRTSEYSAVSGENGTVTTDNERVMTRTFVFPEEPESKEVVTGTYSQSGTTVTRITGSRDFTADDVGKIIYWSDDTEVEITAFTSATVVTVADSATKTTLTIELYGFATYSEIFLSDEEYPGDNLNVHVILDTPVDVYGPTPLTPSQQLKVTYEFTLTVTPLVATSQNLASVISDPGNAMSSNKNGSYAIEGFATATIDTEGETTSTFDVLEPSVVGDLAISTVKTALDPFGNTDRSAGTYVTTLEAADYNPGDFSLDYEGEFGINEAISTTLRSLMLYDIESGIGAFTFLFNANQIKDGDHTLSITFRKTWDRDLT
jgi:hypothetical protein